MKTDTPSNGISRERLREHRRRRFRRHGRRAYIRSVYFLPSLATLGNAVCGFGAMYVSSLDFSPQIPDPWTQSFALHPFVVAAYLIFLAMIFDGLDGRLARFARHTTDFGGQLDSLADMISFGAAPAFLALQLFRHSATGLPIPITRLIWAIAAMYMSCAALRLARFNVSNEHGEQHHFSFLGLPSPGAAGTVASLVLMQQELLQHPHPLVGVLAQVCVWLLPVVVLVTGLLMVSSFRYPHLVNRYFRGKRSFGRLVVVLAIGLLVIVRHQHTLAIGTLIYSLWGPVSWAYLRFRPKPTTQPTDPLPQPPSST
jgi:CDP-diacylglycerol--serine O-phosphatidyltransferase